MNHTYIDEHQIADRYVMGTLSEEEAERFEDHSFTCAECLDRIEVVRSMRRGFRRVAREDAALLFSARQLALVAWLARLGRSRQIGVLFLALVVLAILPAGLSWRTLSERGRDLEATRVALEAERQRSAAGSSTAQEAARLSSELEQSHRELAREREARAQATERLARALQEPGETPTLYLETERKADPSAGPPSQQLRQPEVPIELAVDPDFAPYRVVLKNTQGREIWSRAGLRLTGDETLLLKLPASLLPPGDYTFVAEGTAPGGKPAPAGRFPFRILPAA
jgi:hypothetical protein